MSAQNSTGEELPEDLKSIEKSLGTLAPAADHLDRDRLMYLAGRASMKPPLHIAAIGWPLATAASLLVALTFGGLWLLAGRGETRIVYINSDRGTDATTVVSTQNADRLDGERNRQSYFQLRNTVLVRGVDALPSPQIDRHSSGSEPTKPAWPLRADSLGT